MISIKNAKKFYAEIDEVRNMYSEYTYMELQTKRTGYIVLFLIPKGVKIYGGTTLLNERKPFSELTLSSIHINQLHWMC